MHGAIIALLDGFDHFLVVRRDLEVFLGTTMPLQCFKDSKQIFEAINRGQHITEKRLMDETIVTREAQKQFEFIQIVLVSTHNIPADGLTNVKENGMCGESAVYGDETKKLAVRHNPRESVFFLFCGEYVDL